MSRMTAPSDWEAFQDEGYFGMWCVREKGARRFGEGFHTVSKEEAEALASALSSLSLSLSEASAERDEAEAVLHGLFRAPVHLDGCLHKDNARLPCQCGAQDRYRALEARVHKLLRVRDDRPALENGKAPLADATSNPPLSDLSSLRKGAEVMREAIEDAVEKLNTYRGAAVQTVIDQLEAALVSGSREDGE